MIIDNNMIDDGYISIRKHPECDYYIYNYTAKAQYDGVWNESTLNCRGLIMDIDRNIIARPFSKFFNYEEYGNDTNLGELPKYNSFEVYEKMDGSLGILYPMPNGELRIATRGSFESKQSKVATRILKEKYPNLPVVHSTTWLFEIIYPENRIVVDYGEKEDLVLLTIIDNQTGLDLSREFIETFAKKYGFPLVKKYDFKYFDNVLQNMSVVTPNNREGFVVRTDTGFRFKLKFDEYKRLHRLITGVNEKHIWEILKEGQSLDNLLDRVPDEFNEWVRRTKDNLESNYKSVEHSCKVILENLPSGNRKEIAEYFLENPNRKYSGVLFAMYDGKYYSKIIWKLIQPEKQIPYKVEN